MNQALIRLSQCGDIGSLESALRAFCSDLGPLSRLDVLPLACARKHQAVCLIRLKSAERQQELMAKLGALRRGEDLYVVIDLETPESAQTGHRTFPQNTR